MDTLDGYGKAGLNSPEFREKTLAGAVMCSIFRLLLLILVTLAFIKMWCGEPHDPMDRDDLRECRVLLVGPQVEINVNMQPLGDFLERMDLPTLNLELGSVLTFFETPGAGPSIQKIEVEDLTKEDSGWVSTTETLPVTRSSVQSLVVPMGSFDPLTGEVANERPPVIVSLNDVVAEATSQSFKESLKVYYQENHVFDNIANLTTPTDIPINFFNHTVSAYVRVSPIFLETHLKKCQLQVTLMNAAHYVYFQQRGQLGNQSLFASLPSPAFTSVPSLWNSSSFDSDDMGHWISGNTPNMFVLQSEFGWEEVRQYAQVLLPPLVLQANSQPCLTLAWPSAGFLFQGIGRPLKQKSTTQGRLLGNWLLGIDYVSNFEKV